uniref:Sulfotransferase n=1 Tax=Kalanchoe fedtschenkoi TaxID=63787 RepID=A0A7N1A407_KALFE
MAQQPGKNGSDPASRTTLHIDKIVRALPARRGLTASLKQYQGHWFHDHVVPGIISVQEKFRAKSDQIVLASFPKSGTTWLKALLFCLVNRSRYDFGHGGRSSPDNPLISSNPHACVPFLEIHALAHLDDPNPDSPILSSHLPHSLLPRSVVESGCKIVYVMREPKDVLVSLWMFAEKAWKGTSTSGLDAAVDMFCDGFVHGGPYWDHVVGYMNASLKSPDTILTMTYEDLMERPVHNVKRLADFIGQPFSTAEEDQGVVEGIVSFCSFDKLSNLEVNKTQLTSVEGISFAIPNDTFFRKARIGDWETHLNDEKRERLDDITRRKFKHIDGLSHYSGSTSD